MEYYKSRVIMRRMQLEIVKKGFILALKDIVQSMGEDIESVDAASKKVSGLREAYDSLVEELQCSLDEEVYKMQDLEESHEV